MNLFHGITVSYTVPDNHGDIRTIVPLMPDGGTSSVSRGSGMAFTI